MRSHSISLCAHMETCRPVDTVSIQQRHCKHIEFHSPLDKLLGLRRAFQKTEGARAMQFHIALSHTAPLAARRSQSNHESGILLKSFGRRRGQPDPTPPGSIARESTTHHWSTTVHKLAPLHIAGRERKRSAAADRTESP